MRKPGLGHSPGRPQAEGGSWDPTLWDHASCLLTQCLSHHHFFQLCLEFFLLFAWSLNSRFLDHISAGTLSPPPAGVSPSWRAMPPHFFSPLSLQMGSATSVQSPPLGLGSGGLCLPPPLALLCESGAPCLLSGSHTPCGSCSHKGYQGWTFSGGVAAQCTPSISGECPIGVTYTGILSPSTLFSPPPPAPPALPSFLHLN